MGVRLSRTLSRAESSAAWNMSFETRGGTTKVLAASRLIIEPGYGRILRPVREAAILFRWSRTFAEIGQGEAARAVANELSTQIYEPSGGSLLRSPMAEACAMGRRTMKL